MPNEIDYKDGETNHDDSHINNTDDGLPMICPLCKDTYEMHEGVKSLHSDHQICPGCHVDEMIENENR